jgi:hypothetical protein
LIMRMRNWLTTPVSIMRNKSPLLKILATISASLAFCASGLASQFVYDNSTGWLNDATPRTFLAQNGQQIGDQVTLGGTERILSLFELGYWLNTSAALNPNLSASVSFYANNGSEVIPGLFAPGQLLGTGSALLPVANRTAGYANTLEFAATDVILLPETFTYSVTFSGLEAGDQVGWILSNPATVGSSGDHFWMFSEGAWNAFDLEVPANFAARVTAVPEPTTLAYALLAGLLGLGYVRFSRKA